MKRIAICDDELTFLKKFAEILSNDFDVDLNNIQQFLSPRVLLDSEDTFDIIFLDIDMPEMNGFNVASFFDGTKTLIVFVTNKDTLVYDAFNSTDAFGFIRKNSLKKDLVSIMNRYNKNKQRGTYITIKSGKDTLSINLIELFYLEKTINSVIIHTASGDYRERNTLSFYESKLAQYGFIRSHAGYIINLDHIASVSAKDVIMSNGEKLPVSRKNVQLVKQEYLKRSAILYE